MFKSFIIDQFVLKELKAELKKHNLRISIEYKPQSFVFDKITKVHIYEIDEKEKYGTKEQ